MWLPVTVLPLRSAGRVKVFFCFLFFVFLVGITREMFPKAFIFFTFAFKNPVCLFLHTTYIDQMSFWSLKKKP